ncbi:MAG: DUF1294 domain-containing protein [Sedimentibacter sp.]|uniref:DUF1294 domain-containing protein n=1 Tax=Sedimentibacter sp. TaxID=1960295 RepID=UPI003158D8A7
MIRYLAVYFIIINVVSFALFYADKQKARKDRWRIEEKTLHITSFLGGTPGSIAAMILFHHKTRKAGFVAITIIALLFNILAVYGLYTMI